jgi:RNA polymerase sigma-70 factor (ECF subfamily)
MAAERTNVDPTTDPKADLASDADLVREVIDGSQQALARLYDRHGNAVFAAAMRASRDHWIAAEVVQETFLTLWNRAELFDQSRGALATWLLTIARNRAVDRLRSASRHDRAAAFSSFARTETDDHSIAEWLTASGQLIGAAGPELAPEIALTDKETRASIDEALGALNPLERRVIMLAYGAGLSQSEIASSLGWPIGTVKTRTRRALRHLREQIERPQTDVRTQDSREQRIRPETGHAPRRVGPAVGLGDCLAPC